MPALHWAQIAAPCAPSAVENVPATHGLHHVPPVVEEYVPAMQVAQAACAPGAVEYVPALHMTQVDAVCARKAVENVPALQEAQIVACAAAYVPAVQTAHGELGNDVQTALQTGVADIPL